MNLLFENSMTRKMSEKMQDIRKISFEVQKIKDVVIVCVYMILETEDCSLN